MNKKLYILISETSWLWKKFEFSFQLELQKDNLIDILNHSVGIKKFHIPNSIIHASSDVLDFQFTTKLRQAGLLSLDLTGCRLSSLCFISCFSNLKELNQSECVNLVDEDLEAVRSLSLLESLYLSFNNFEPSTVVRVCSS